ncbi:hypothetical protein EZV62_017155 [Acer yangbiense]|uniref:MULE transposase domain-containing protein n=1 Tax=Acer yangbiense TaxID=1000413 RepID=A0A5C7HHJ9_9ROSI|nr:hypothetical protein EZV62_017155 [Acer yangbiense]
MLTENLKCSWLVCSKMNMSHGMFTNGTSHLDLNNEGHSRWHEADTTQTQTLNDEYNPNDIYNNSDCKFHVPFAQGHVSTTPVMFDYNLVQPIDDLLHSELVSLQATDIMGKEFISVTDAEEFYKKYSYFMGFSMRKDRVSRDTHGLITIRRWAGSYTGVGHTGKDLQNRLDAIRRSASHNSDANSIISYMTAKSEMDQRFFFRYTIMEDGSMCNLFWSDSMSQCDYKYFGDVISFNSTYRTNCYNRPLVIFVGVNNHTKTTIFGFGLLVDEMIETYTWILQTFLEAMHGKCPISVVTDSDRAMGKAISLVMPSAVHRLCSWHLERNVQTNVGDSGFTQAFTHCMLTYMTESEFETQWLKAIETRLKLYEFMNHIDKSMSRLRNNEIKDDFDTINEHPVLVTHLLQLEKHVAEVYTHNTFAWVRDEIKSEAKLSIVNCVDDMDSVMYTFKKFAVGDKTWNVRYGALSSKCSKMSYFASMSTEGYKEVNVAIDKLTIQMKGLLPSSSIAREENVHQSKTESSVQVKDPVIAATKGSIKQKTKSSGKAHKCGNCGQLGHTKTTCHAHVKNNINAMASNGATTTGSTLQPTAYADLVQSCYSKYIVDIDGRCQPFAFHNFEVPMGNLSNQSPNNVFSMTQHKRCTCNNLNGGGRIT